MLRSSKKWLPVLLVLGLTRDCQGCRPVMSPAKPEIYIDEGNYLELTCTSAKRMRFYYPIDINNTIVTSRPKLEQNIIVGHHEIIFQRSRTVHGDTGWYGCANHDSDVTPGIYDQPEVRWTYVYVTSRTRCFVELYTIPEILASIGDTVIVPCRPNSPHYKVKLTAIDKRLQASYDPRLGFKLTNITFRNRGYIKCKIVVDLEYGKRRDSLSFHLIVKPPDIKYMNLRSRDDNRYYRKHSGGHIEWVVDVDAYPEPELKWLNPREEEIMGRWMYASVNQMKHAVRTTFSSTTLRISHLDVNDIGQYSLRATNEVGNKTLYFTLEVLAMPKLLFSKKEDFYLPKQEAEIVCEITAFPAPTVSWTFIEELPSRSFKGRERITFKNYSMESTISEFHSVITMTMEKSGILFCVACNIVACNEVSGKITIYDCEGCRPVMSPPKPEIHINEGDYLELTCTSAKRMRFYYPIDVNGTIVTSPMTLKDKPFVGHQEIIFRRSKTVRGDTGWYGCANHDSDVTPGIYDQPEVRWTYVYVTSKTDCFVEHNKFQDICVNIGDTVTVPCRPTSPHYKVMLRTIDKVELQASYDPRLGFKLRNIMFRDRGYIQCELDVEDVEDVGDGGNAEDVEDIEDVNNVEDFEYDDHDLYVKPKPRCCLYFQLIVKSPSIKYINVTSRDDNRHYRKHSGGHVEWVVNVDGYPVPELKWLYPSESEIIGGWTYFDSIKRTVSTTSSSTTLRINYLDVIDMGVYSLRVANEVGIKTFNFTLEVLAEPMPLFIKKHLYLVDQKIEIVCEIIAFPAPNVSWTFLEDLDDTSLQVPGIVTLKNSSMEPIPSVFYSVFTMTMEKYGRLACKACNSLGCDEVSEVINITDVYDGFSMEGSNNQLIVYDDVEVVCAVPFENFLDVQWLNDMDDPVAETDRISTIMSSTLHTKYLTLRIKNLQKFDNNSYYVCEARANNDWIVRSIYKLLIYDPMVPFILDTNMNKTTIALELSTGRFKPVVLKCYVWGVPIPDVTWYKDDIKISSNEQYEYRYDNQELHIKYLLNENSGRYTCKVENSLGTVENYQIISINEREISKVWIMSMVVLVLTCVILVIYSSIKTHRQKDYLNYHKVVRKQLLKARLTHFQKGALHYRNPELTVDDEAELLPYDKKWEFPRERLKFGKQLGCGAFGVVIKANALGICKDEAVSTVAVKMVRQSTGSTYIRALASELKIMMYLGKHLNVVNLLGACTTHIIKHELLVIVEYCRFGNLHNYLLRHRADFVNQIDPATHKLDPSIGIDVLTRTTSVGSNRIKDAALSFSHSLSTISSNSNPGAEVVSYATARDSQGISIMRNGCVLSNNSTQRDWRSTYKGDHKDQNLKPICTQDLLSWAFQVARGMEYLSQRKVLHGDLAARNILLAENNVVKISDFGLAKILYRDCHYKQKDDAPLPVKWMAIESIRNRVFSTQSDIWSFGIVLWEFFTLAKTPYSNMGAEIQYQRLIEGYRMEQPEFATDKLYNIMLQCWKAKPTLRPTFTYLVSNIGDLLEECVKEYYVDLNTPYMAMNTTVFESGKTDDDVGTRLRRSGIAEQRPHSFTQSLTGNFSG